MMREARPLRSHAGHLPDDLLEAFKRRTANLHFTRCRVPGHDRGTVEVFELCQALVAADGAANYYKIARAAAYLVGHRSCLFVVTNPDPAFTLAPAAGAAPPTLSPAAGVWARAVAVMLCRAPTWQR